MVYNLVQKQKMKKIILIAIAGLVLLAIIFVIAGVNIQSYIDKKQTNMIDLVKRSIPTKYPSVTLGSMLENYPYFKSYQWRDSTSARGEHFVRFIAEYNYVYENSSNTHDLGNWTYLRWDCKYQQKEYGTIAVDFVMSLPTESGEDWSICDVQVYYVNYTHEHRYYDCDRGGEDTTCIFHFGDVKNSNDRYYKEDEDVFLQHIYNQEELL